MLTSIKHQQVCAKAQTLKLSLTNFCLSCFSTISQKLFLYTLDNLKVAVLLSYAQHSLSVKRFDLTVLHVFSHLIKCLSKILFCQKIKIMQIKIHFCPSPTLISFLQQFHC